MIFHWIKDEDYKAISLYLKDKDVTISLHFEDALSESCWTYIDKNKDEDVFAGVIPTEFVDALYEHIKDRKC